MIINGVKENEIKILQSPDAGKYFMSAYGI